MKVTEPSETEWAAPFLFAPKNDGSPIFSVYYQKLYTVTECGPHLIPRIEESIILLGDTSVFSTFNASHGFWQVKKEDSDSIRIAFTSEYWLHRFSCIPLGLLQAPSNLNSTMDVIFISKMAIGLYISRWQVADEHIKHVWTVLQLLCRAGSTSNLKNCKLFTEKIDYLEHLLRPGRLPLPSHTTDETRHLEPPLTVTKLRSFLDVWNVYHRLAPNLLQISDPLNAKMKKREHKELNTFSTEKWAP